MSSIQVLLFFRHLEVSGSELGQTFIVHGAHWFGEVAEHFWIMQIEHIALIVGQHPWEDRILSQILS